MHATTYGALSDLVKSLSVYVANDNDINPISIHIVIIQHDHTDEHNDFENNTQGSLNIELPYSSLTPSLWKNIYSTTDVSIINGINLDKIYEIICREVLRISMFRIENESNMPNINSKFILEGFIASISIIFSQFVTDERIDYDKLNFRLLYLIFSKLKELDNLIGFNVQLNESLEIWNVVDKIFIPCKRNSDYQKLVEYLSNYSKDDESEVKVLGRDDFISLQQIFKNFGINSPLKD